MYVTLSLLLLLASVQQIPPSATPSSAQEHSAQPSSYSASQEPKTAENGSASEAEKKKQNAEREKRESDERYEKCLYHAYEWATIVGAFIALGALIFIAIQTTHTARNADALVNSERAWVKVEVTSFMNLSSMNPPPHIPFIWIRPIIINVGRTPARLTRIYGRAHRVPITANVDPHSAARLPQEPDYSEQAGVLNQRESILPQNHEIHWFVVNTPREIDDIKTRKEFLYVYGYVDYIDVGGHKRQTRFCRLYWIPYGTDDPVEEGWVETPVMPPAYTEST
jgi:hypothetical protein